MSNYKRFSIALFERQLEERVRNKILHGYAPRKNWKAGGGGKGRK